MTQYKIYKREFLDDLIVLVGDNPTFIPPIESNPEYQKYLAWVADGNVAELWDPGD